MADTPEQEEPKSMNENHNGIKINEEVLSSFETMRKKKSFHYCLYKISDDGTSICVDKCLEGEEKTSKDTHEKFVESLPEDDCRFALYHFKYLNIEEADEDKIIFILWCPMESDSKVQNKYMSAKGELRKNLQGVAQELYISHEDDLDYQDIEAQVCGFIH